MAQVHVITGPTRYRSWSEEQKRALVTAAFAPGAVVTDVARQADVSAKMNDIDPQAWLADVLDRIAEPFPCRAIFARQTPAAKSPIIVTRGAPNTGEG